MVVTVEQGASVTRICDGCHSGARSGGPGKFLGFFSFDLVFRGDSSLDLPTQDAFRLAMCVTLDTLFPPNHDLLALPSV